MHDNLRKLNAWCDKTGVLHLWVSFQNRSCDWAVRVLTHARGKGHPIRTCTGTDLEAVCEELLPKAQKTFEEQKASIMREYQTWSQHKSRQAWNETAEIEAMHHTAADF